MAATYYLDNVLLNWMRNAAPAAPAGIYLAALTAATNLKTPTVTEVTGGAYARQALTLAAPASGVSSNSANVTFPVATADWGTVTHVAIYDAVTGGNCLQVIALSSSQAINTGNQLAFDTSTYKVTVTVD